MAQPKKPNKTAKEYESLGRVVATIYESGYLDKAQSYKTSFVKGLLSGLGGAIGATILVGILIWLLSIFGQAPFIGHIVNSLRHMLQTKP